MVLKNRKINLFWYKSEANTRITRDTNTTTTKDDSDYIIMRNTHTHTHSTFSCMCVRLCSQCVCWEFVVFD